MAINDVYHETASVDPGDDLVVDAAGTGTGAAEVFEVGGEVDVVVYRETDIDGDGTFETSVQVDAFSGPFHSQKNQLVVSQANNHRLRIHAVDSNEESGDVYATGMEVSDNS